MYEINKENIIFKYVLCLVSLSILCLYLIALQEYKGNLLIYTLFTIVSNSLLFYGFRRNAIFFDTFIGVFLWFGFWLKLTVRVTFLAGEFNEPVGYFDGSATSFDTALIVTACGLSGLMLSSFIREKFIFNYLRKIDVVGQEGFYVFYKDNRCIFLVSFVLLFVSIAAANLYFGIYQRGVVPRTELPYGLSGVVTWLLLFGCASISAIILRFELRLKKNITITIALLCLFESFLNNISLLSRGMILNVSALVYGANKNLKLIGSGIPVRLTLISFAAFSILFISSIYTVNYIRTINPNTYSADLNIQNFYKNLSSNTTKTKRIFIDRWVGMEPLLAVSSYPEKSWKLWKEAWDERFSYKKLTFYDENLVVSQYRNIDLTKYHSISVPGVLAFCFYPGSYVFLFFCMMFVGLFSSCLELFVYKFGGQNIILCALFGQVVAYRFTHFGYVPAQSYLLFGTLFLNVLLFYVFNYMLCMWYKIKKCKLVA